MNLDDDRNSAAVIADAVNQISERASLIVREEIELAKAEVSQKVSRLVKGAVVGGAAAVFAIFGVVLLFHGLSWLAWYEIFPSNEFYWGFFLVAAVLFILGGLAGLLAAKLFKSGAPPVPQMAIDEARKTKEELSS
jgi:uncharacterized membrane protein YqjE